MTRIQQHWQAVLATFFPRRKGGRLWPCTTRTRRTAHGYCDMERRIVEIGFDAGDDDKLNVLLIYEIAHAVAPPGHGKNRQRRIVRATAVSRNLGRYRLAELLEAEIDNYRDRGEPLAVGYQENVRTASFGGRQGIPTPGNRFQRCPQGSPAGSDDQTGAGAAGRSARRLLVLEQAYPLGF
jgi:hypothetical protein